MRLLLHCCCGPCATGVMPHWAEAEAEVVGWFFNPNLLPEERARRREGFARAAAALGLRESTRAEEQASGRARPETGSGEAVEQWNSEKRVRGEAGLLDFLLVLAREGGRRCRACYRVRLEGAAREALANGCEAFSTTLLISPYQDLEAVREVGEEIAAECGVRFEFVDLRWRFQESRERARELGLYQQKYCGCLFSELERAERRAQRRLRRRESREGGPQGRLRTG